MYPGDELVPEPRWGWTHARVAAVEEGRYFVVTSAFRPTTGDAPAAERLERGRSRFVSRYRIAYGKDVWTRLAYGPSLVEPMGFVMDRGMLLGVKKRVEGTSAKAS